MTCYYFIIFVFLYPTCHQLVSSLFNIFELTDQFAFEEGINEFIDKLKVIKEKRRENKNKFISHWY